MKKLLFPALSLYLLMPAASSEILLIDAIAEEPPNSPAGLLRPKHGSNMQTVETRFGSPLSARGPIGEPPISSWEYENYTVYFEQDTVIDTVVHRK